MAHAGPEYSPNSERPDGTTTKDLFSEKWNKKLFLSVGLDPDSTLMPASLTQNMNSEDAKYLFLRDTVTMTHDLVSSYKLNSAFFEGDQGRRAMVRTMNHIRRRDSSVPIIIDAKRCDVYNTNLFYAHDLFDKLGADAVTVHFNSGEKALAPFISRRDKETFVVCRMSEDGAGEIMDLYVDLNQPRDYVERFGNLNKLGEIVGRDRVQLYEVAAYLVAHRWNKNENLGLVMGSRTPEQIEKVRKIAPNLPILIPGIGEQEGNLRDSVKAGLDLDNQGIIISASRSILYAGRGDEYYHQIYDHRARIAAVKIDQEIKSYIPKD